MRREYRERFPRHRLQRKPLVSNPGTHHGTCVMHVPWCMSGSLTRGGGENVPGIPGACATRNFTYLARGPCVSGVSAQNPASVSRFSRVLKRCNVISGTLKPNPSFRGKRCIGLARPVDNQWQKSHGDGRRLRWCHPSATLGTDFPWVAAVNLMPSIWTSFCGVVRGSKMDHCIFQTRVILQGWRINSSVRNVIEIVELTHSYYKKWCFYFPRVT